MGSINLERTEKEYREYCVLSIECGKAPISFDIWLPNRLKTLLTKELPAWIRGNNPHKFDSRAYILYMEGLEDTSPNVGAQLKTIIEGIGKTRFLFDYSASCFRVSKCDEHEIFLIAKEEKDLKVILTKFLKDFNGAPHKTALLDVGGTIERIKIKAKFYAKTILESAAKVNIYWEVVK